MLEPAKKVRDEEKKKVEDAEAAKKKVGRGAPCAHLCAQLIMSHGGMIVCAGLLVDCCTVLRASLLYRTTTPACVLDCCTVL